MIDYLITEVDGKTHATEINAFNGLFKKEFLPLKERHLESGFWWLVHRKTDHLLVGFAGMTPFEPFPRVGYHKRCAILKDHRGHGLQQQLLLAREDRAKASTDWTHLVSETHLENVASSNSFIAAGYRLSEAERPWAKETLFWIKKL